MTPSHRVLRVHGGRLVVAERRLELESELDAAAGRGLRHRELVRRRRQRLPGAATGGLTPRRRTQDSVKAWMETTRSRPDSLAR